VKRLEALSHFVTGITFEGDMVRQMVKDDCGEPSSPYVLNFA
jgi:hypothetical protein